MENRQGKAQTTEEIDLTQFFRWIGQGFKRLGNNLVYFLAVLRNLFFTKMKFFAVVIVVGLGFGFLYATLLQKQYYQATMVLSCDYLNTQILENIVKKMNQLAGDGSGEGLARELQIQPAMAKQIQRFSFEAFVSEDDIVEMEVLREQLNNVVADKKEVVDKVLARLMIDNKNAYEITVDVYSTEIVKDLEMAIISYFRQHDYIQKRMKIREQNLLTRKAKLVKESRKLDSLKEVVYLNLQNLATSDRGSNNVILSDEITNPLALFTEDLRLNTELLAVEESLFLQEDFELIDGFTPVDKPTNIGIGRILAISFIISFVTAYLLLGAFYLDRKLANYPIKSTV